MYGKGGWNVVPRHRLPIRKLNEEQERENSDAQQKHEQLREAFARDAKTLSEKYGVEIDADDEYPYFEAPHPTDAYDFENFSEQDWAVYNYAEKDGGHWGTPSAETLRYLKIVVDSGVKVSLAFMGGSASSMDATNDAKVAKRDGPEMPDWLREVIKR